MNQQAVLESTMLLCFGLAWPVASLRMLRARRPEGKGLAFTLIILAGYVAGAAAKWLSVGPGEAIPGVFWLYVLNGASVTVNLALQWYLARQVERARRADGRVAGGDPAAALDVRPVPGVQTLQAMTPSVVIDIDGSDRPDRQLHTPCPVARSRSV
jgi:hypothetical protein